MQYRKFGGLDWNASVVGFGCMRLPTVDGNPYGPNINEAEAVRMIRHALERGVNYFDTADVYHEGRSETVLGKALRGHRDQAKIATKCPVWLIQKEADFDRILTEQLSRLQTDCIDLFKYQIFIPEAARAGACIACHDCEDRCPQKIPISEWMPKVDALLGAA